MNLPQSSERTSAKNVEKAPKRMTFDSGVLVKIR
jgi:hypothetical protein